METKEGRTDKTELIATTTITLVIVVLAFVLFWCKREGGAYFIGMISTSPAAVGAYYMGKNSRLPNIRIRTERVVERWRSGLPTVHSGS